MMRWTATAFYRSSRIGGGLIDVTFDFEELHELHDLIERGPDWHTLDRIEVRLAAAKNLTIEQAAEQ